MLGTAESAFVCVRVLRIPVLLARNVRVVTTNPLAFVSAIGRVAGYILCRRCYRRKDGKRHAYWALVESYRTDRGPPGNASSRRWESSTGRAVWE